MYQCVLGIFIGTGTPTCNRFEGGDNRFQNLNRLSPIESSH